jgi:hypothetical protein
MNPQNNPISAGEAGPKLSNYDPVSGETGLPWPNDRWLGHLSKENAYTLDKLQALDPNVFAPPVMAAREKLHEVSPLFAALNDRRGVERGVYTRHQSGVLAEYAMGKFVRKDGELIRYQKIDPSEKLIAIPKQMAPVNEFTLGRNFVTPSYVKSYNLEVSNRSELPMDSTISAFSEVVEFFSKTSGATTGNFHISSYEIIGGQNVTFAWINKNDRKENLLMEHTEIASITFVERTQQGELNREYSLIESGGTKKINRQVWFSDPDFIMPNLPTDVKSLSDEEREKYYALLAGLIENTHTMEESTKHGYALVSDAEVLSILNSTLINIEKTEGENP